MTPISETQQQQQQHDYPEMNKPPNHLQYKNINLINYETSQETYHQIMSQITSNPIANQCTNKTKQQQQHQPPQNHNQPIPTQTPKHQHQKHQHVGLILWYQHPETDEIEILTGIETHYLTETFDPTQDHTQKLIKCIQNFEHIENCSSHKIANQIFKERASFLSNIFQIPISFESMKPITQQQQHQTYETHFRVIKNQNKPKYGIVKGNVEEKETPFQAMVREMQEEIQISLSGIKPQLIHSKHIFRFQHSTLHTYHYQINEEEYKKINQTLQITKPQGEIMEISFRKLSKLNNNKKTNAKTTEHIKTFQKYILKPTTTDIFI
jgi:ADP-ribose pyrophosphatase YjhB (NUDIX family)